MAIASTGEWQPVGNMQGPPDLMFARTLVTGDASGGDLTWLAPMAGNFIWIPLWVHVNTDLATAQEVQLSVNDLVTGEALIVTPDGASSTIPILGDSSVVTAYFSRGMVVRSSNVHVRVNIANTNLQNYLITARAVRFPANFQLSVWQMFLTGAQGGP